MIKAPASATVTKTKERPTQSKRRRARLLQVNKGETNTIKAPESAAVTKTEETTTRSKHQRARPKRRAQPTPQTKRAGSIGTGERLNQYPRVTDVDYFDDEASGRKQARLLAEEISRRATWIDAKGQQYLNERPQTNNNDRRRFQLIRKQAVASTVRRTIDDECHALAGLQDNPPPSVAETTGPIMVVPRTEQQLSFSFKAASADGDDEALTALLAFLSASVLVAVG